MKNICYILITIFFLIFVRIASAQELIFDDFNDQDYYNNFSGDYNKWENPPGSFQLSFVTSGCRSGACLKVDYSVPSGGYGGIWNSLIGKIDYKNQTLNFTDLYDRLKNSSGNPSDVNNVQITEFSFWAKGNGTGNYTHTVNLEFKDANDVIASKSFLISNISGWTKYSFPVSQMTGIDLTRMKQAVFALSDYQNEYRTSYFLLDDLSFTTTENTYDASGWSDDTFLDLVTHRAFNYFLRFTDTRGFALDRSTYSNQVSVGAIGYQLSSFCVGNSRGWADGLADKARTILQNLNSLPMGRDAGTVNAGYKGFYYHFLDATTGTRIDTKTELSLYDTMLLMYGVMSAKQCFPGDSQIQTLAQALYDRVEWDWMVDPSNHQFYLGWSPESGPLDHVDGYTDEALLVDVLGLGSATHPTTLQTYNARSRPVGTYPSDNPRTFAASWTGSLFNYFFAAGWLDLKKRCDAHPTTPLNIWENNRCAIVANRQFCIDNHDDIPANGDDHFTTYSQNSWGLTAVDNLVLPSTGMLSEYYAFGALPTQQNIQYGQKAPHVGTIAVYGAGGSMPFLPQESIQALRNYYSNTTLWSPLFGFGDSYSTDPHYFEVNPSTYDPILDASSNLIIHPATWLDGSWVNHMMMGINIGPMLLSIENYRSGLMWNLMAANTNIQTGLNSIFTDVDNDEDGVCAAVDCDDNNPDVHGAQTWYRDADNDGYSDGVTATSCTRPAGYKLASELLALSGDCDDGNLNVHPGTTWYYDADGDGYGNPATVVQQCTTPGPHYVLNSSDCKDDDPNIYTGSPDVRTTGGGINYYASLQSAYNAASEGSILQSRAVLFTGNLNFNINKTITLSGGYDCAYTTVGGKSKVNGLMTITRGTVIISNFELH